MKPIYLDYNATTPIAPRVADAMLPFLHTHFGNPSSSHEFGLATRDAVERARRQVAEMLGCRSEEIIFTSGGSESNNYAIKGVAGARRDKGNHIITSSVEHPAVSEVCRYLETRGYRVTYLPVDKYGLVDPAQVEKAISPETILITIMHANNEVGTIEPIADIARIAREHDILMHSDCAQSVGKIPVRTDELGVDLLSIAGHKLYAPKGIGALYIRSGIALEKFVHGADHERNLRAGTENVLEIVGLGEACAIVSESQPEMATHFEKMRDRLETGLRQAVPELRINGHPERRLPNTSSVSFPGLEANTILSELTEVAASAGAACHSEHVEVSAVLEAMRVPLEFAMGTIRFSVGRGTTADDIDSALAAVTEVIGRMQPRQPTAAPEETGEAIKLTRFTHGLGCACKLRPQLLEQVLASIPALTDANILVGADTADDAAVYRLDDKTAIVQTVDFFTPVVDDPYDFGAIAAANSLSDIYAMGATPLFALNVVGFPSHRLPMSVLRDIMAGARAVCEQAGISIIGGHTVDDTEPKYGLVVTGRISPDAILTNVGAHPGDVLILTKPIGTGILSTALKQGRLDEAAASRLVDTMSRLNRTAAEAMAGFEVHACTDVTGFGLLGHTLEMMAGSQTSAEIRAGAVPLLPGVRDLAVAGVIPGGTRDNDSFTSSKVAYVDGLTEIDRLVLNDAQTSGGLLIAVAENDSAELLRKLHERKVVEAAVIGRVTPTGDTVIRVIA